MAADAESDAHLDLATRSPVTFTTVVCGLDNSPASLEAVRQAPDLAEDDARFWGVASWDPGRAMHAGIHAGTVANDLREQGASAVRAGKGVLPELETVLMRGGDVASLLSAASNLQADLMSVGSHGTSRPAGILFGSVATAMTRHAPCSVLIARARETGNTAPSVVLHATDGSLDSVDAFAVAARIAERHSASLISLNVADDRERGAAILAESAVLPATSDVQHELRVESGSPDRRVVESAGELGAGIIVVGSRGMTGLKALGSVSERVAHRASCSVLIVRRPVHPAEE